MKNLAATLPMAAFDAINAHDLGAAPWWDENSVYDMSSTGRLCGRTEIMAYFQSMLDAFPDLRMDVHEILSNGARHAVRWTARGTFAGGPFNGLRPTGGQVEFSGVDVLTVDGGVIVSNKVFTDGLAFARQVGMLPPDGSAADRFFRSMFNGRTRMSRAFRRSPKPTGEG